jgi:D-3-phosphoglycerate dehydrogenase / 2-oxoglutarate reductase
VKNTIRIALDLDGVLTEHPRPLAHAANTQYDLDLPDHTFVDSAGLNVPLAIREWVYSLDGPARDLLPATGAQEFVAGLIELFGAGNVSIITARPGPCRALTVNWLRQHDFPTCNVVFADEKVPVARELGITHAVEDSPRHASAYATAGILCLLLSELPAPDRESPAVHRVQDLRAVKSYLQARHHSIDHNLDLGQETRTMVNEIGRPRIVISDIIDAHARAVLSSEAEIIDVDGTDLDALLAVLPRADALIVRSETMVTEQVLAAGPRLRVVARAGVGIDNIDVPSATAAGILVLNAPGANAISAAEHTIALLLSITRSIPEANRTTHAGCWERKRFKPFDLKGKTIGIVGLGHVGSALARRLHGFEPRLIGHDPYITRERFQQLGVEPVSYETLLATSDIVTFHVPATPETVQMLDAAAIARLRPGAIVLNCARGEIVEAAALAEGLCSGQIAAAGVDVYPHEPARESPLFGLPNAILTPHLGGSSKEALATVGQMISATTLAALRGEAVPNAVNLPPASLNAPDLQRLTRVATAAGHLLAVLHPARPGYLRVTTQGLIAADIVEHVIAAALSDALEHWTERRVTPVNARLVAEENGLLITSMVDDADPERTPEFTFEVNGGDPHRVTVRWDRADAGILEVDRFSLERPLVGDLLITHHRDRPGIVGRIGMILGADGVNIAGMQVARHRRGGAAIMVVNVDDAISDAAQAEILQVDGIETAYVVSLPRAAELVGSAPNGWVHSI